MATDCDIWMTKQWEKEEEEEEKDHETNQPDSCGADWRGGNAAFQPEKRPATTNGRPSPVLVTRLVRFDAIKTWTL